tara:strand:+ start:431 stop:958 length:528 start_codon:yes stop_codon:yes gene_type:complete
VIKQDILEKPAKSSYLGIGSNLGDRFSNIKKTMKLLNENNILIEDCSSYYETPSWPNKNFPKYLNLVIKIKTETSLLNLFTIIKKIEKKIGRKKSYKNYPRVCDIDILDYRGLCLKYRTKNIEIITPHPRMHKRNFVIFPLHEVNKSWIHPKTKANINSIINQFRNVDFSDIRIV